MHYNSFIIKNSKFNQIECWLVFKAYLYTERAEQIANFTGIYCMKGIRIQYIYIYVCIRVWKVSIAMIGIEIKDYSTEYSYVIHMYRALLSYSCFIDSPFPRQQILLRCQATLENGGSRTRSANRSWSKLLFAPPPQDALPMVQS